MTDVMFAHIKVAQLIVSSLAGLVCPRLGICRS